MSPQTKIFFNVWWLTNMFKNHKRIEKVKQSFGWKICNFYKIIQTIQFCEERLRQLVRVSWRVPILMLRLCKSLKCIILLNLHSNDAWAEDLFHKYITSKIRSNRIIMYCTVTLQSNIYSSIFWMFYTDYRMHFYSLLSHVVFSLAPYSKTYAEQQELVSTNSFEL